MKRLVLGLIFAFVVAFPVAAQSDPTKGLSFEAIYDIESSTRARMTVTEKIEVDFVEPRQGILRYIPQRYTFGAFEPDVNLNVDVLSIVNERGERWNYIEYVENRNLVLRIGDEGAFIEGPHVYVITYTVDDFISIYENGDEFFWDVNGTGWSFGFETVSATVRFPQPLASVGGIERQGCLTGVEGSTLRNCEVNVDSDNLTMEVATTNALGPGENLSILAGFESGYFVGPEGAEKWAGVFWRHVGIILPFIGLPIFFGIWRRHGRDPEGAGFIVPQYDAPQGMLPIHVGTLTDFNVDNRDLSASIIDLAVRGYIRIIDHSKTERAKKRKYEFELLNIEWGDLQQVEIRLLEGLFSKREIGAKVKLDSLKNKFYETANKMKEDARTQLQQDQFLANDGKTSKYALISVGVTAWLLIGVTAGITEGRGLGWIVGLVILGVMGVGFGIAMPKRTQSGVDMKDHILGLKEYLALAEADRLAMMQSPDAPYAGKVPDHTVDLYERLLPYAIALEVEKEWTKKFEDVFKEPPQWYQGHWSAFNAGMFANTLSNGLGHVGSTMVSTPSSSGGSGFSAGSSGGGFGGGGGGSW